MTTKASGKSKKYVMQLGMKVNVDNTNCQKILSNPVIINNPLLITPYKFDITELPESQLNPCKAVNSVSQESDKSFEYGKGLLPSPNFSAKSGSAKGMKTLPHTPAQMLRMQTNQMNDMSFMAYAPLLLLKSL